MAKKFKIGDHVSWNSEAGRARGTIVRVHTKDILYKGYTHHASTDDPQYEIKSDKTEHIALHRAVCNGVFDDKFAHVSTKFIPEANLLQLLSRKAQTLVSQASVLKLSGPNARPPRSTRVS